MQTSLVVAMQQHNQYERAEQAQRADWTVAETHEFLAGTSIRKVKVRQGDAMVWSVAVFLLKEERNKKRNRT